ncbi:uncharacterized protein V1510DRAFT_423443 [Dipodascopsis tothii]|uniref:uncharacterized protein n=1 Tax=Dipodascopsis tothii TaxID=44089 RepID=UPI0034CDA3B6
MTTMADDQNPSRDTLSPPSAEHRSIKVETRSSSPVDTRGTASPAKRARLSLHDCKSRPFWPETAVTVNPPATAGYVYLQTKACRSLATKALKCVSCSRRKTDLGGCRFNGLRYFREDVSAKKTTDATAYAFKDQIAADVVSAEPPPVVYSRADAEFVLDTIAPTFLQILRQESAHESRPRLLRLVADNEGYRSLCDVCASSLFSGYFMCFFCGLEVCIDCFDDWTTGEPGAYDGCVQGYRHKQTQLVPVSSRRSGEVRDLLAAVASRRRSAAPAAVAGLPPPETAHYESTDELPFGRLWAAGSPFVLTNVALAEDWSPQQFVRQHGSDACYIVNADTDIAFPSTVGRFFEGFPDGSYEGQRQNLKLKDWPTTDEFRAVCPDLFRDFETALPAPKYTRRAGCFNLASVFPATCNPPDLGPKMYNAYPSRCEPGGKGTTNLHLDVTDAINIMAHATVDGGSVGAVWHIFDAVDAAALRAFIRQRELEVPARYVNPFEPRAAHGRGRAVTDDPVHRQIYYLTTDELDLLRERHGVTAHRLVQRPGDAVFIPAGCAHQVCNLSPCIKIAADFVSPENVGRCYALLHEIRRLARVYKKEDILQLKQLLCFAWEAASRALVA